MAVQESLNNRAWPFLQDAPPQPQRMEYDHAHEAANNTAVPIDTCDMHDPANGGWLLGLRSFLPMTPYGTAAAAPAAEGLSPLHGVAGGDIPAGQAAQGGGPIQWLPGTDKPMQSLSEGTAWSHGDSALMATDSPPRPAEQTLSWGSQLGAAFANGAASTQPRSPTGRGPRGCPAAPEGPPQQPDADAEARGGSGGDGSLASSATAMQDIRASPVLRALDGWGGASGRDHPSQAATPGACPSASGVAEHAIHARCKPALCSALRLKSQNTALSNVFWCAGHAWQQLQQPSAGDGRAPGAAALSWGLPAAPLPQQPQPSRKPIGRRSVPNVVQSLTSGQTPRPSRAGIRAPTAEAGSANHDEPLWYACKAVCQ